MGRQTRVHKETGELYEHLTIYSCAEDNVICIWDAETLTCKGQLNLDMDREGVGMGGDPLLAASRRSLLDSVGGSLLSAAPSAGESSS